MKTVITDALNEEWIRSYQLEPINWHNKSIEFVLYQANLVCFKASQMLDNKEIILKALELKRPVVIVQDLIYLPYESREFFIAKDSQEEIAKMFQYAYLYGNA